MLAHYGVVADPARVADPNRKGSVENAIQHTQGTALAGRRFETLEAQNEFLRHWEENWASKRIHGSTRRQVAAMFQEEKPHLRPLPVAPFRIFTEVVRTVCDDTTVRVDSSYYAARPAAIGSLVVVRIYASTIEIRDRHTHALLRIHPRMTHPGSVVLPTNERPFNPRHGKPPCCWRTPAASAHKPRPCVNTCSMPRDAPDSARCGALSG